MDGSESSLLVGGLPLDMVLRMEYERGRVDARHEIEAAGGPLQEAYDRGFREGIRKHAADRWEAHAALARFVRTTAEEFYERRLAQMAAAAVVVNRKLGRPDGYVYPGGPVDWETGMPA